jgi:hypothetical protein
MDILQLSLSNGYRYELKKKNPNRVRDGILYVNEAAYSIL